MDHRMRTLAVWCCLAWARGTDVAVQTDGTMELLEPKLGGVALQLRELEAMRERGTLTDTTFKHAVHETTVLGPLTASLAAMGVLHDKGQLSDEELAFAKSVAFLRYERGADGQVLLPGSENPSPTPEATVTLKTSDDKEREAEAKAAQRRAATKLAMEAAEEKARKAEAELAAEKERKAREQDAERAAAAEAKRAKKEAEAAAFEAAAAAADAAADAETAAAARRAEAADAEATARRAEADRVEEAEKIAAEAQAYADEATAAGNAEAAAEAETIAAEARAAVAEARAAAEAAEVSARDKEAQREEEEAEAAHLAAKAAEEKAATETAAAKDDASPEESIVLDTTPDAEPADEDAAAFMAAAAAEKAYFDETTKKEAADVAAAAAREKAATEPLAKAREAARGAQCEGWHQTGRCTPEGPREAHSDRTCDDDVPAGASGYCECGDHGRAAKSDCDHASFKCQNMCAARQASLLDGDVCRGWRQTGGCTPHGPREAGSDKTCDEEVPAGSSGYCECHDGTRARESDCDHGIFTCGEACAVHLGLAGG